MNQPMPPQQPYQQQQYPPQGPGQQPYPPQGQAPYPQQGQPQPQQPPAPQFPILVSTMNDVPGQEIVQVIGEVAGLTVRSRGLGANFAAGFRALGGGEIHEYTQLLYQSRHEAIMRMCQHAMAYGANAVIAMRFDCNEIANTMSEVAAYGTAVVVKPVEK
ncbi:YbjQ family protein [Nocardia sp. NPDC004582]